jgi:ADP-ribose pyrophosphatase YjhB (NUDIX family)
MTQTATRNATSTEPWIRHDTDAGGPVNPVEPNLPPGSSIPGRAGEVRAVDPVVTVVTTDGQRWLLLIRRGDGRGWAFPGGKLNPGESVIDGVVRELGEETGLVIPGAHWWVSAPRYVHDPRNRRNMWFVTVAVHVELATLVWPPFVEGLSDADRAAWLRADSPTQVRDDLAARYGGVVFAPHNDLIDEYLA